jgi:hypothetical protein
MAEPRRDPPPTVINDDSSTESDGEVIVPLYNPETPMRQPVRRSAAAIVTPDTTPGARRIALQPVERSLQPSRLRAVHYDRNMNIIPREEADQRTSAALAAAEAQVEESSHDYVV